MKSYTKDQICVKKVILGKQIVQVQIRRLRRVIQLLTEREPINEHMPVKTSTLVWPHRGEKWKTRMKTNTNTELTYNRNAAMKVKYLLSGNYNKINLK